MSVSNKRRAKIYIKKEKNVCTEKIMNILCKRFTILYTYTLYMVKTFKLRQTDVCLFIFVFGDKICMFFYGLKCFVMLCSSKKERKHQKFGYLKYIQSKRILFPLTGGGADKY